ncbi:hypothetical protein HZH68_011960 [Vespula germanica]|uniref:Protein kinase domain-containing protein n=1 Tax=Vespula germanica TaxID=30212 RepID=A0A834JJT7_VESGE|nr:hypothetical protein HZH68_011960 [Vespula germanica]
MKSNRHKPANLQEAVTDPRDGRRVALKKLPNVFQSLVSSKRVFRELKMLCFFKHENVLSALDILQPPHLDFFQEISDSGDSGNGNGGGGGGGDGGGGGGGGGAESIRFNEDEVRDNNDDENDDEREREREHERERERERERETRALRIRAP